MALVAVADHQLWTKRIRGDDALRTYLEELPPGAEVVLRIDGVVGPWQKMKASKTTGASTPGLSPLGASVAPWRALFRQHGPKSGVEVDIELVGGEEVRRSRKIGERWESASEAEREAAWEAFKALSKAGWRSDGPYGPRDELYDRDRG